MRGAGAHEHVLDPVSLGALLTVSHYAYPVESSAQDRTDLRCGRPFPEF
jgi:hypothetical protein